MSWDQPEFEEIVLEPSRTESGVDPQTQYGCRCDVCPLAKHHKEQYTWAPVPPSLRSAESHLGRLTAVSEFPASSEVINRMPLFGEAGSVFMAAFVERYRLFRKHLSITNLVLCRYPGDDPKRFMAELKRQWKKDVRVAEKAQQVPPPEPVNPVDACRPQLQMVLKDTDRVLLLGSAAAQQVIGTNKSVDNIRGGFYELVYTPEGTQRLTEINQSLLENPNAHKIQAVPAYSPALPLRDPVTTRVFWRDMERAYRWWTGTLEWTDVTLLSAKPSPDELRKFFERPGPFTFDIETTRHGPRLSVLRTIGITDTQTHEGYVIPFESIDGKVGFFEGERYYGYRARVEPDGQYAEGQYPKKVAAEIFQLLRDWLLSRKVLCGHNALLFDLSILELYFGLLNDPAYLKDPDPIYILDGLALSRCEQSERRRNLYLQGTLACDVPDWKGGGEDDDEIRVAPRTYEQLAIYNLRDCKVTSLTLQSLWPRVVERKQQNVAEFDRKAARVAREMTHLGIRVDQTARAAMEKTYTEKLLASREKIVKLVGNPKFNPASATQLGELLYGRDGYNLPILKLTDTGAASTDDDTLRDLMPHTAPGSTERELLAAIRFDRSLSKTLGTGILPLRMWNDLRENSTGQMVGGLCDIDGRVHPQYPIFNPATGRFASKDPNSQNYESEVRKVFIPEDGHAFLMADFDQIELRLFAAMAKVKGYLDVFKLNGDPHAITAILIYQDAFLRELIAGFSPEQRERYERLNVPEKIAGSKKYNDLRTFAKTFVYCVIYGGTADTVYLSVSSATDENGKLMFPDMTRREVDVAFKSFMRNAPEIPGFWQTLEDYGHAYHCVVEPIYGRRRDYLEFDRNGILNHPIQCVTGDTRVTTEHGLVPIRDLVGTRFKAWTGTVWAEATAIQKDVVPTYQVTTLGLSLTVDATHSFLVDTSEGYEWVHTTDLQEHRVALDMARPLEFGGDHMSSEDAFWLGYFIANGHATGEALRVSFTIGVTYQSGPEDRNGPDLLKRLQLWVSSHKGTCWVEYLAIDSEKSRQVGRPRSSAVPPEQATHYKVGVSQEITRLLKSWVDLAQGAHTKNVPEVIWVSSLLLRREFIRGVLYGDGYIFPDGAVSLQMCNHQLVQEMTLLARSVGIVGHVLGPYGDQFHYWRGVWQGAQCKTFLGFGHTSRLKFNPEAFTPTHEIQRVWPQLVPTNPSDATIRSRIRGGKATTNPYVLARMGATRLYDHATVQVTPTGRSEAVYTLCVFHDEHRYVANGVISKNSGAAAIATTGLLNLRKVFVPNFREKLGIVNQMHDAFTIEVREDEARDLAKEMNKCINQRFDHIGDVDFSAEVDIMTCWRGKKDDFHPLDPKYKPPKPKES